MFEKINDILAQWDPIGVGLPISQSEYTGYVPQIISSKGNQTELENCIKKMLDNIGLFYDSQDELFNEDLQSLINKIQETLNKDQ